MCQTLGLSLCMYFLSLFSYPSCEVGAVIAPYYQVETREGCGEVKGRCGVSVSRAGYVRRE